jgi:hypothetical protein
MKQTVIGTTLHAVLGSPATKDAAGFAALAYVEVGEVTQLGEYGAVKSFAQHQPLKTGVTEKLPGFINYGAITLTMGKDISDAGQVILKAGGDGANKDDEHSFKVILQDGTIQYFSGFISGPTTNVAGGDSVVGASCTIEINTPIIEVTPEPEPEPSE